MVAGSAGYHGLLRPLRPDTDPRAAAMASWMSLSPEKRRGNVFRFLLDHSDMTGAADQPVWHGCGVAVEWQRGSMPSIKWSPLEEGPWEELGGTLIQASDFRARLVMCSTDRPMQRLASGRALWFRVDEGSEAGAEGGDVGLRVILSAKLRQAVSAYGRYRECCPDSAQQITPEARRREVQLYPWLDTDLMTREQLSAVFDYSKGNGNASHHLPEPGAGEQTGEPWFTTYAPKRDSQGYFLGALDYILHMAGDVTTSVSELPTLSDALPGMPNERQPSDHLPISADIVFVDSGTTNDL
eukprot:TRINITY_DN16228_c0_g1_i2.p3 TRINITY_DN16228_c0_g1~~TRINITY_DN16228_c0_g1_i2.p3  ORF type:complete len:298 (+),score=75.79 TRINITY_DN16228_c0_g1_i2:1344-2237(+)